jgi:glycosyltransferase involved in cell wall biosynthesis
VATAVGGVAEAAGDASLLVEPCDPAQPAAALQQLAANPGLREGLAKNGLERVRGHTIEAEAARVAAFIAAGRAD